jgi:hypothetical protein
MSDRSTIAPSVVAAITERAPPRLVKKLDGAPRVADSWTWTTEGSGTVVTTDAGERVTLPHPASAIDTADAISCSCLLSPKCFHVLAVASVLPLTEAATSHAEAPSVAASLPVIEVDRAAATRVLDALARVLDTGLSSAGAIERADVLRAVHGARVAGLHRLAADALSFVESGRALRERSASFDLAETVGTLGDALVTGIRLERGDGTLDTLGVARRAYEPIGALRLVGLACEPIVTRSGYAGVVTYVVDDRGRVFTIEDVMPGDVHRAVAAYDATLRLGEASATHRELSRAGLFVQGATASADHRLGAGASVSAVSASGATFEEPPIAALFAEPLARQIDRAVDRGSRGLVPRAASLVFVSGIVLGRSHGGVAFLAGTEPPRVLTLTARVDDEALASGHNLRMLGDCRGLSLRVVGHLVRDRAGVIEVVSMGPMGSGLTLSPGAAGKLHVAHDRLARAELRLPGDAELPDVTAPAGASATDPLEALERRLSRLVLGGRRTLTTRASAEVAREAALLEGHLAKAARAALEGLLVAAARRTGPRELLEAWVRAFVVVEAMRGALGRAAWR